MYPGHYASWFPAYHSGHPWGPYGPYGPAQPVYMPQPGFNDPQQLHQAGYWRGHGDQLTYAQQQAGQTSTCEHLFRACQAAFPKLPAALAKALALFTVLSLPELSPCREYKGNLLRYHMLFRGKLLQQQADEAARELERPHSEARGLVLEGLQQLSLGFLQGSAFPALGFGRNPIMSPGPHAVLIETAEGIASAEVEVAVQQVLHDPSMAVPAKHAGRDDSAPVLPKPSLAQRCAFPQEAQGFVQGQGITQLHKAALKNVAALQQGCAGISITADADFGIKRLVPHYNAPANGYSWPYGPGSHDSSSSKKQQNLFYRQLSVTCSNKAAMLVDIRGWPARPCTFALADDQAICLQSGLRKPGRKLQGKPPADAIGFAKGELYPVTVVLDAADSAQRGLDERGVLQQMVLFTFLVPSASFTTAHASPCTAELSEAPQLTAIVVGRRVAVALTSQASAIHRLSNLDAPSYVPSALKLLFDCPPSSLIADPPPYAPLFSSRGLAGAVAWWDGEGRLTYPPAACHQLGAAHAYGSSSSSSFPAASSSAQAPHGGDLLRQLRVYQRLLLLEEAAMEDHIRRHDLFNARLDFAVFNHPFRYKLVTSPDELRGQPDESSSAEGQGEEHIYRGPDLGTLLPRSQPKLRRLAALNVPGLLEGRPVLLLGDVVYLRLATTPDKEYAGYVVVTVGGRCLLALPDGFWRDCGATSFGGDRPNSANRASYAKVVASRSSTAVAQQAAAAEAVEMAVEAAAKTAPRKLLAHVRFSFDRAHLRRMHAALRAVAGGRSDFHCLPDADESASSESAISESASGSTLPADHELPGGASITVKRDALPTIKKVRLVAEGIQEVAAQKLNAEQRLAVASVLCGAGGSTPFALFGPPGTGKTVTLVESALQVLKARPSNRLLLCAPGNYSADLLAAALQAAGVSGQLLLRLNDPRRPPPQVLQGVLPLCPLDEKLRAFALPTVEKLLEARVVVATCSAAGMLREGHYAKHAQAALLSFSHVMIDEAAQAMVPEALIPMALLRPRGRVLLCGDPKQLGPIVRSAAALAGSGGKAGLAISLHERFIQQHTSEQPLLLQSGRAPATVQLVRNYRSHASLLHLPNRLFYNDTLVAAADQSIVLPPTWAVRQLEGADDEAADESEAWQSEAAAADNEDAEGGELAEANDNDTGYRSQADEMTSHNGDLGEEDEEEYESSDNTSASMLFYGVRGQQMQVGEGGSFCNPVEAASLVGLVLGLLQPYLRLQRGEEASETLTNPVTPAHVGIIATYRNQVQKLRMLLREKGLGQVRCGTVDDFQGQEAHIVFISTVLSRAESLPPVLSRIAEAQNPKAASDPHLGFWRNPKRFNVATTRARALLVVVGHPVVLIEDGNWRELLRHCAARGAYKGAGANLLDSFFTPGTQEHVQIDADEAQEEETGKEAMTDTMNRMAEMSLLGIGAASQMFPSSMDDVYSSMDGADAAWRIGL